MRWKSSTLQRPRKVFESGGQTTASLFNGGLGRSPQWGPGAEPLVRGSGGEALLKLKHLAFGRLMEAANLPTFLKSRNTENQTFVLSRQCGHRTIFSYFCRPTPSSNIRSVEWNFSLRSKLLPFDALCCSLWHARCVCCPSVRLWVTVVLWLNNAR